jgi:hypothetical protein
MRTALTMIAQAIGRHGPIVAVAALIGAASLAVAEAAPKCSTVSGQATSADKDDAFAKAKENAQLAAQATLGPGVTQQRVGWVACGYDEDPGVRTDWECTVEVQFCTTEVNIPRPSLPGYTPPATFKPPL